MNFLYLIFYVCKGFGFWMWKLTRPRRPVPDVCWILCSNELGLAGNRSDVTVTSYQYDILSRSETLVSDVSHFSELLVPRFGRPVLLCRGMMIRPRGMAAYVWDGYGAFRQPKFECSCCEMLVLFLWCETEPLCVQTLPQLWPRWPDFWLFTIINGWLPCRLRISVPLSCLWAI